MQRLGWWVLLAGIGWAAGPAPAATAMAAAPQSWPFAGATLHNEGGVITPPSAGQLNPETVGRLAVKWRFDTAGDVTATPTVEPGGLYVPDWGGLLWKLHPATGRVLWFRRLSDYTGIPGSFSRTSPAIGALNEIVLGDQRSGTLIAVDRTSGALRWKTLLDGNASAKITASPVIYNHTVYVGVASGEEVSVRTHGYVPSFRGSVVALDEATGVVRWRFVTVPAGYTGGAILGGPPAINEPGNALLVTTGNNYALPPTASQCVAGVARVAAAQLTCLDPTDYVDAVLSLDLASGRLNWARRVQGADTWTLNCFAGISPACPAPAGADDDFAASPNLMRIPGFVGVADDRGGTSRGYVAGVGQKSGIFWALDPANGGLFWKTKVGTSLQWGSAVNVSDSDTIFVAVDNGLHYASTLAGRNGVPQTWNAGSWGAIQMTTGRMLWQIPAAGADLKYPAFGGAARSRMTFVNRVVFAGSTSGVMAAMDAGTGRLRWTFASGATVESAPAIFDDTVYWGTGYARNGIAGHTLFAFAIQ